MNEQQLRRSILALIFSLRPVDPCQVPDHDATVAAGRGYQVSMHRTEFDLIHLVLVAFQREELALYVASVPYSNGTIGGARDEQVGVEGGAIDAHDFSHVCLDGAGGALLSEVPEDQASVVADRSKLVFVVMAPADILHYLGVCIVGACGIERVRKLVRLVYIPHAYQVVV